MRSSQGVRRPGVAYGKHVQAAKVALGASLDSVCKIYLDTNFWLRLRDVCLGRNTDTDWCMMRQQLQEMATAKQVVCPLSEETFREVFLQSDSNTLKETLRLIDQLSLGTCLLGPHERMHREAFHFIRRISGINAGELHPLNHLVWTRTSFAIGHPTPMMTNMDEESEFAIQTNFFDYMWKRSLSDMVDVMGDNITKWDAAMPDMSKQMNEGKSANYGDYRSFQDLFLIELRGVLECHKSDFSNIMHQIIERDYGRRMTEMEQANDTSGQRIANIIYWAFEHGKITNDLPTFNVFAKLHAGMRWDRQRKYKANDLADIRHACTAIPYCDFFFTERSLCHLVSDKTVGLASTFPCQTISNVQSALDAIRNRRIKEIA